MSAAPRPKRGTRGGLSFPLSSRPSRASGSPSPGRTRIRPLALGGAGALADAAVADAERRRNEPGAYTDIDGLWPRSRILRSGTGRTSSGRRSSNLLARKQMKGVISNGREPFFFSIAGNVVSVYCT